MKRGCPCNNIDTSHLDIRCQLAWNIYFTAQSLFVDFSSSLGHRPDEHTIPQSLTPGRSQEQFDCLLPQSSARLCRYATTQSNSRERQDVYSSRTVNHCSS
jgi:hypothetical protein